MSWNGESINFFHFCIYKAKATKLELELTDLRNVDEPQSEDLTPLVCADISQYSEIRSNIWHYLNICGFPHFHQEEDLQEIITKISSKQVEYDKARGQMAELKASYEQAEQEYNQHKEQISSIAEEAETIKVMSTEPTWSCQIQSPRLTSGYLLCPRSTVRQEELSKADQEVMKCKHHKNHYKDKRNANLQNIKNLEAQLKSKKEEIEVGHTAMWRLTWDTLGDMYIHVVPHLVGSFISG